MIVIRGFIVIAGVILAAGFLWFSGTVICLGLKEFFKQYASTNKKSKKAKTP